MENHILPANYPSSVMDCVLYHLQANCHCYWSYANCQAFFFHWKIDDGWMVHVKAQSCKYL